MLCDLLSLLSLISCVAGVYNMWRRNALCTNGIWYRCNPMQIHYMYKTIRVSWNFYEEYTCLFHIDSSFFFCFAQLNLRFKLAFSDHLLYIVNPFVCLYTLFYIFYLFFRTTGLNLTKLDKCQKHSYAHKENSWFQRTKPFFNER